MPKKLPKKKNSGFSMVEVLIAIAIFAILLIPIISGIIRSMNRTTDAKTLQYRNEFAENIMEYVKEDSLENILKGTYLGSVGAYSTSTTASLMKEVGKSLDSSLDFVKDLKDDGYLTYSTSDTDVNNGKHGDARKTYAYEQYWMSGNVKLGTKHETYAYKLLVSNKEYAEKEAKASKEDEVFVNPNNLALGVVEDIDYNKIALINGTIANYDNAVSNAFLTKKLEVLKKVKPDWYEIQMSQKESPILFPNDTVIRQIIIKVTGSETAGYKVTCSLDYKDIGGSTSEAAKAVQTILDNDDYHIVYTPFEFNYEKDDSTGKAKLPNIYLMYNVCLYNAMFAPDDYIVIDTSGVTDDTEVKCYIVQTAERYSKNLTDANTSLADKNDEMQANQDASKPNTTLYNNNTALHGVYKREDVKIHILADKGSNLKNLSVYHNFDIDGSNSDVNRKSSTVLYNNIQTNPLGKLSSSKYNVLVTYDAATNAIDTANSVKNFDKLNKSNEESRGLYEVKMWIEEGSDPSSIDTSKSPTMTATKGGDES